MDFKELKVGSVVCYREKTCTFGVVLGISDYNCIEDLFLVKSDYSNICIAVYPIVIIKYYGRILDEEKVDSLKDFLNVSLTYLINEPLNPTLIKIYTLDMLNKTAIRMRTKEVTAWMLKNKLVDSFTFKHIFDIDGMTRKIKKMEHDREIYYKYLLNNLSFYDKIPEKRKLRNNFSSLSLILGNIYVLEDNVYKDEVVEYLVCLNTVQSLFYSVNIAHEDLKYNLYKFVIAESRYTTSGLKFLDGSTLHDTGVNVLKYWYNKDNCPFI